MGIAIHYKEEKLYWIDKDIDATETILRNCDLDGSNPAVVMVYGSLPNATVSPNSTDLFIDFKHNNTAFFIDEVSNLPLVVENVSYFRLFI